MSDTKHDQPVCARFTGGNLPAYLHVEVLRLPIKLACTLLPSLTPFRCAPAALRSGRASLRGGL